jgi:hypothetical protein
MTGCYEVRKSVFRDYQALGSSKKGASDKGIQAYFKYDKRSAKREDRL